MSHLLREHAPITAAAWSVVDEEARSRLRPALAARRLVDFRGPHGWEHSALNLGRVEPVDPGPLGDGVQGRRRRVLALAELRAPFTLDREELRAADRGAEDPALDPLDDAARRLALAENAAVFHGWPDAGITGIVPASPHTPVRCGDDTERYACHVAHAVELLLGQGVGGPYGLALGGDEYARVIQTAEHGGYPLFDHLAKILAGGPIVWAPGLHDAVVLSLRGGDFLFECGEDIGVGYDDHDAGTVALYLEESFTFLNAAPEAAVPIVTG